MPKPKHQIPTIPAEAYEGDYTDPSKSAEVDNSYDRGYLDRRKSFVDEMKRAQRKRRKE